MNGIKSLFLYTGVNKSSLVGRFYNLITISPNRLNIRSYVIALYILNLWFTPMHKKNEPFMDMLRSGCKPCIFTLYRDYPDAG